MIIVQLDSEQLSNLIQSSVRKVLKETPSQTVEPTDRPEQLLSIQQAAELLSLTVPTLYSKVSKHELPVCKAPGSKRLYFSRSELMDYIKTGRKKSNADIEAEAAAYLSNHKKGLNHGN
jgi:excisionase family DNA binding protein